MIVKVNDTIELKSLAQSDALAIFNTIDSQRIYLGKWLPFVAFTKELSDTENFINSTINIPEDQIEFTFSIRKQGEFVGLIGLKNTDTNNKKIEIGYWLSEKFQGQGIITKSVETLCDFIFKELQLNRIEIKCAVENQSSIKIPKRLGFTFEGIERQGEWIKENIFYDIEVYSKLKSDE